MQRIATNPQPIDNQRPQAGEGAITSATADWGTTLTSSQRDISGGILLRRGSNRSDRNDPPESGEPPGRNNNGGSRWALNERIFVPLTTLGVTAAMSLGFLKNGLVSSVGEALLWGAGSGLLAFGGYIARKYLFSGRN